MPWGVSASRINSWNIKSPTRVEDQLLNTPIEQFGNIDLRLRRACDLVNPSELLELLTGLSKHTEHFTIQIQLVDPSRIGIGAE